MRTAFSSDFITSAGCGGSYILPTLIVIGGYQKTGHYKGEEVDIEEMFLKAGYIDSGSITGQELGEMADQAVQGPAVCAGMGTANTMHIAAVTNLSIRRHLKGPWGEAQAQAWNAHWTSIGLEALVGRSVGT